MKNLFTTAAVFVLVTCSHAQNLLVNGSFEYRALGWTFTGGLSILGPPSSPALGVEGTNCASIGGADIPNSTLSQSFSLPTNTDYLLTFNEAANGDNYPGRTASGRIDVLAPDNSLLASYSFTNISPGPLAGTNGFIKHTFSFTNSSNADFATVRITDTSANGGVAVDLMVDDVSVLAMVPPVLESGPPVLILWPTNQTVLVGSDVFLPAEATGAHPMRYQWWFNGHKLPRQTNSVLSRTNIQLRSRGRYQIEAKNSLATIRTEPVRIKVVIPPHIITRQRAITAETGGRVVLSATATGSKPFRYQWLKDGDAIATGTNRIFRISSAQAEDAGTYSVRVANIGATDEKTIAELTVTP